MWFARFQILICEHQNILRKLLVLSWFWYLLLLPFQFMEIWVFLGKHSYFDFSSKRFFPIFPGVKKYNFLSLHFWKLKDTFWYISFIVFNQMRFQFHDYFSPNVTGTRKLFQKFWTTKFHQSEFGRQEPSTKRGSWDGHTQILTCFWPPLL